MNNFKKRAAILHRKKPYIEPVFLFLTTTALGFFLSMYASFLDKNQKQYFWCNQYLWLSVILLVAIVLYYIFLSTYSFVSKSYNKDKVRLLNAYISTTKSCLESGDIDLCDKANYIFSSVMDNLDRIDLE